MVVIHMGTIRNDMSMVDEEIKIRFLQNAIEILDENNIDYWLEFGTLLGCMRDKKFIPWDDDIDLATIENIDKIVKLKEKFAQKGMSIIKKNPQAVSIRYHEIPEYSSIHIDIDQFNLIDDKPTYQFCIRKNLISRVADTLCHAISKENPVKHGKTSIKTMKKLMNIFDRIPENLNDMLLNYFQKIDMVFSEERILYFSPIKTRKTKFYDMHVKIPSDVENHLIFEYGEKWMIPDKNFNRGFGADFVKRIENGVKICEL